MPLKPISLLFLLLLGACADVQYSDAPTSNIEVEDGEHWDDEKEDTPIVK